MNLTFPIKFIHTADIHLGSMLNIYDEKLKDNENIFKNAVYEAFERIVDYALKFKIDFLLISGDLYDRDAKSIKANSFFYLQCNRLLKANINVYIIAGNHDPFVGKKEIFKLPDNVFICDSEQCSEFQVKDKSSNIIARVYGNSYRGKADSRKLYNSYNPSENSVFNVAMLHTELNPNNFNYAPCSLENLKAREKISYWALGHIHKCKILSSSKPIIAYSGIPQGRDIGEEGIGGCLLVEVDEASKTFLKFLPAASIVWKKVYININEDSDAETKNLTELIELIEHKAQEVMYKIEDIPWELSSEVDLNNLLKGYAVRWIIEGRGHIKTIFEEGEDNLEEIIKESLNSKLMDYSPFIYTDSIEVRIEKEMPNIEEFRNNNNIVKEIEELCNEFSRDASLREEISGTFGQIWEKNYDLENTNDLKMQLDEENFKEILRKAKELIIYRLMEDS